MEGSRVLVTVYSLGFKVWGSGLGLMDLGVRATGFRLGLRAQGLRFSISS